jgi:hypothetical protein
MASLKDLRGRITSVKSTQKITKAMQMVAAAKLRRATEAAESARPYATRMAAVIANWRPACRAKARRGCWPARARSSGTWWWWRARTAGLRGASRRRWCARRGTGSRRC